MCSKNTLLLSSRTVEQSPSLNGTPPFPTSPVIAPSMALSKSHPVLHMERHGLTKCALEVIQGIPKGAGDTEGDRGHRRGVTSDISLTQEPCRALT